MEPIERSQLLDELDMLGYRLVRPSIKLDPLQTLTKLVQTNDSRLLEGFPVALATSLLRKLIPVDEVAAIESNVNGAVLRKRVRVLVAVTYVLLAYAPGAELVRKQLFKELRAWDQDAIEIARRSFEEDRGINVGGLVLAPDRLRNTFVNYIVASSRNEKEKLEQRVDRERTRSFDSSMAELFSPRQRQIIERLLRHEELTKTEKEYYSRVIKKRLKALANSDVQEVSRLLIGM